MSWVVSTPWTTLGLMSTLALGAWKGSKLDEDILALILIAISWAS
jgi:hypothetical protein